MCFPLNHPFNLMSFRAGASISEAPLHCEIQRELPWGRSILQHDMAWNLKDLWFWVFTCFCSDQCFWEDGWLCIVMDYCEGGDLAGKIKSARQEMWGNLFIFCEFFGRWTCMPGHLRRSFRRIRLYDGLLRPQQLWCSECFWKFGTVMARPSLPSNTSMIFTSFIEIWSLEISSCPKVVQNSAYSARHSAFWDSWILLGRGNIKMGDFGIAKAMGEICGAMRWPTYFSWQNPFYCSSMFIMSLKVIAGARMHSCLCTNSNWHVSSLRVRVISWITSRRVVICPSSADIFLQIFLRKPANQAILPLARDLSRLGRNLFFFYQLWPLTSGPWCVRQKLCLELWYLEYGLHPLWDVCQDKIVSWKYEKCSTHPYFCVIQILQGSLLNFFFEHLDPKSMSILDVYFCIFFSYVAWLGKCPSMLQIWRLAEWWSRM